MIHSRRFIAAFSFSSVLKAESYHGSKFYQFSVNRFAKTKKTSMSGFENKGATAVTAHDALAETSQDGKFVRTAAGFREFISKDHPVFQPGANRYHLYISYACPWANRCVAMLKLKGLDEVIGFTAVHPTWQRTKPDTTDKHCGWAFYDSANDPPLRPPSGYGFFKVDGCEPDTINGAKFIRDLYEKSRDKLGKYSVPVLWDKKTRQIVNNESSEIMRMFNDQFQEWAKGAFAGHDFYPEALRKEIDAANDWVYPNINDGVYKCGFAKTQQAYDQAVKDLYDALDKLEDILSRQRYIVGNTLTEADIRAFMTLVRFDEVYVVYFKCNIKRIIDYPHIHNYIREIYQLPGMSACINMDHIKKHYFSSHPILNAYSIVPHGPNVIEDLKLPHNRATLFP